MWCKGESENVEKEPGVLEHDRQWGWVHHESGDRWHTVGGDPLVRRGDIFIAAAPEFPQVPDLLPPIALR